MLIALPHALDCEAYAARIRAEPGWEAVLSTGSEPWDVRLSDRCRVAGSGEMGTGDLGPTVVISAQQVDARERPACGCCWVAPRGAAWLSLFRALAEAAGRPPQPERDERLERLTRRELEVLRLVGLGKSVNDCAEQLGVTPSTVGNHKYRLMRKLGVKTSLQLLRIAISNGLADLE